MRNIGADLQAVRIDPQLGLNRLDLPSRSGGCLCWSSLRRVVWQRVSTCMPINRDAVAVAKRSAAGPVVGCAVVCGTALVVVRGERVVLARDCLGSSQWVRRPRWCGGFSGLQPIAARCGY